VRANGTAIDDSDGRFEDGLEPVVQAEIVFNIFEEGREFWKGDYILLWYDLERKAAF